VLALAALRAAPPAHAPNGSLAGWVWLLVTASVIVVAGVVLTSRR
jgi:hypothetical protein